jgi:predicted phage terminase large subunit-like protein
MPNQVGARFLERAGGSIGLAKELKQAKSKAITDGRKIVFHRVIRGVNSRYRFYRFHAELVKQLQRVIDGDCKRLIVSAPPRFGKSELSSRLLPAAYLLAHPDRYVGILSHSKELAEGFSRNARDYYAQAGGVLKPDSKAATRWDTMSGGGCWATGVLGTVVGRSGGLIIADDTVASRLDADSKKEMAKLWGFYTGSLYQRLEPDFGAIVIVATRWSENDLTGRILEAEKNAPAHLKQNWTIIDWPALSEEPGSRPPLPPNCEIIQDWREKPGLSLCPQRYDEKDLEMIRQTIGPREWSSQYQQRPAPEEGNMFQSSWWQYYTDKEELPEMDRIMTSVDCTLVDNDESDYVVVTTIGQSGMKYYVLDMLRRRAGFQDTLGMILAAQRNAAERGYDISGTIIELAANGYAAYQTLQTRIPGLIGYKPRDVKKEFRLMGIVPTVEAGNVYLPKHAPWLDEFLNEFNLFPAVKNDDICDSVAQAINYMNQRTPAQVMGVRWSRGSRLIQDAPELSLW